MANPWFRMYSEFMHDPKVQIMTEQNQRRLVMLLCMRCNGDVTLQDEHVTFMLRITHKEWQQTKDVFISSGFIDSTNKVLNWDKRQFVSDSSAARVAKHREKNKPKVTKSNVTVTSPDTDTDTDTDTEQIHKKIETTACPIDEIVSLYHKLMPENPECRVLNNSRRSSIKARWLEAAKLSCEPFGYSTIEDGLKAWEQFFAICAQSKFLTGKAQPKAGTPVFFADIDFLMAPSSFAKCLENKYHRETA